MLTFLRTVQQQQQDKSYEYLRVCEVKTTLRRVTPTQQQRHSRFVHGPRDHSFNKNSLLLFNIF